MSQKFTYGGIVLGDDSANNYITLEGRAHSRGVDESPLYGAADAATFATGNARNTVSFSVEQQYDSDDLAQQALADWPDSLPGQADLVWLVGASTRHWKDATLKECRAVEWNGSAIKWSYTFTGGAFTTS